MVNQQIKIKNEEVKANAQGDAEKVEALIIMASRGERGALSDLCEQIARSVLFRAIHIVGNQADAEDLAQEVLVRVCERIRTLRDPKAFKFWLAKIISNEANRFLAKKARMGVVLNIDDYVETVYEERNDFIPSDSAENVESRKTVMGVIATLSVRQREAVMLHYYDCLSVTEVAEAMNVSKQSVSEYLSLSRNKLKRELERSGNMNAVAAVPIGVILANALQSEAARFIPQNADWLAQTATFCGEYLATSFSLATVAATVASAVSSLPLGAVIGGVATVIVAAAIVFGVSVSGSDKTAELAPEAAIEDMVQFSGGIDYGGNTVYVNPTQAAPMSLADGADVDGLRWWITYAEDSEVIFEGGGATLGDALAQLLALGKDGEYMLFFRMESSDGVAYTLRSNFYILSHALCGAQGISD